MRLDKPPDSSMSPFFRVEIVELQRVLLDLSRVERGEVGVIVLDNILQQLHELEGLSLGFLFDTVLVPSPDDLGNQVHNLESRTLLEDLVEVREDELNQLNNNNPTFSINTLSSSISLQ